MPYYEKENIVAETNDNGRVLCTDCFESQKDIDGFTPVEEGDKWLEEHVLICDECEQRIN